MEYKNSCGHIREFIANFLLDDAIKNLIHDNFPDVWIQVYGQSQGEQIRSLVRYAYNHCKIEKILEVLCKDNPKRYLELEAKLIYQELIDILEPVSLNIIKDACERSLPEVRRRQIPTTLETLVFQIADFAGEPNSPKPISIFVSFLLQSESLDSDCQAAIQVWATEHGIILEGDSIQFSAKSLENYLRIAVQVDESLSRYWLNATIVNDRDPWNDRIIPQESAIDIPNTDPKYLFKYSKIADELPLILCELINTICQDNNNIPLSDLIVQWFLPIELMSLPVESWQIPTGRRQRPCSGQRCKATIVSSFDRHLSTHGDRKKYWKRLTENLQSHDMNALDLLDPMTGENTVNWSQPHVVGCKFIEHEDPQRQADVWDNLFSQGVSIALWSRQPGVDTEATMAILDSVTNCCIVDLPTSLTEHRRQTAAETEDPPSVSHLSLLWDNPFRSFGNIDYLS